MGKLLIALLAPALVVAASASAAGFEVVGHRGARGLRPENTIPAFVEGVKAGATAVEADVVVTKDRHVVVSHERRLADLQCRGPYIGRFVKNLTLAQVRRMDCGRRDAHDGLSKTQVPVPGAHIPRLDQLLRLVRPARRVRILLEIKFDAVAPRETVGRRAYAEEVTAAIRKARMVGRVTVQSYDWGALREVARREPRLGLMALASALTVYPGSPWLGGAQVPSGPFQGGLAVAADNAGFDGLSPAAAEISPGLLSAAHARGLGVVPYTVDSPAQMRGLIAMGVDGLISDYPDRLRSEADAAGAALARR